MNTTTNTPLLSAELFIATGCAYCPIVMNELTNLLKQGLLASLKITNIAVDKERATELNIRSVPWFSLNQSHTSMVFIGNHSPAEVKKWVQSAQTEEGMTVYIEEHLTSGDINIITQAIELQPDAFNTIVTMLEDEDTPMHVRIGLDALVENFANTSILKSHANSFKALASNNNIRLQIDALHYLALTGDMAHEEFISLKIKDKDKQIQEAATEALETLKEMTAN